MKHKTITPNIDFEVGNSQVLFKPNNSITEMPARFVNYRTDTLEPLAVVSNYYEIVQHKDVISKIGTVLDHVSPNYDFSHKVSKARVYSTFILNDEDVLSGNEKSKMLVKMVNGYDGTMSLNITIGMYRMVCSNGMFGFATDYKFSEIHWVGIIDHLGKFETKFPEMFTHYKSEYVNFYNRLKLEKPHPVEHFEKFYPTTLINKASELFGKERVTTGNNKWSQYNAFTEVITHSEISEPTRDKYNNMLFNIFAPIIVNK